MGDKLKGSFALNISTSRRVVEVAGVIREQDLFFEMEKILRGN
jgi:hypothetical protein